MRAALAFPFFISFLLPMALMFSAPPLSSQPLQDIDLASESADVEIYGAAIHDYTGSSLATGDIDGDGTLDLVIAACDAFGLTGVRSGVFYIVWNIASFVGNPLDLAGPPPGAVSRIFAPPNGDVLYCTVAVGNFNSDEFDDIIFGEPAVPASWAGRVYVVFGSEQFPDTINLAAPPQGTVRINGHRNLGLLGMGVTACDFDGDGDDEIVAAAPGIPFAEIYVIEGGTQFQAVYSTAVVEPGMTRIVDAEIARDTGRSMACADVDSDGRDDLLIGAPGNNLTTTYDGRATLLYGLASLPDTMILGHPAWRSKTIRPEYTHGQLGNRVALGDVNGGGMIDAVIGAYQGDPLGCTTNCGEVYVLYEINSMPDVVYVNDPAMPISRLMGNPEDHWFGIGVTVADLDRDGRDEVVAADLPSSSAKYPVTFIVDGAPTLPDSVHIATYPVITRISARYPYSDTGRTLITADINGDAIEDLVIGARRADPAGRMDAGSVYVILGTTTTSAAPTPALSWVGQPVPNPFSSTVRLDYTLEETADVRVEIYDVTGRRVLDIDLPRQDVGDHRFEWLGRGKEDTELPSGGYFCRVTAGNVVQSRKFVLLR